MLQSSVKTGRHPHRGGWNTVYEVICMKGKLNFIVGLLLGVFLVAGTGAAAAVVETVTATLNQAPIYVDGTRVELTAYNIGG